jgi:hypothetical protein
MKIRRAGAKFFHADRQTLQKLTTVALRNFAKAPRNVSVMLKQYLQKNILA